MSNFVLNQPLQNFFAVYQLNKFMVGHRGYIAGGVFKNIFKQEKYKDIDIFFKNRQEYEEANSYFSQQTEEYTKKYENDKVTAYLHKPSKVVVELIKHRFGDPIEVTKGFDFTITQFVYYKKVTLDEETGEEVTDWKVAYHDKFFEHLHMKRLVIDKENPTDIPFPVNTFNRMFRYGRYGYFPCKETKGLIIRALRGLSSFDESLVGLELYNGLD